MRYLFIKEQHQQGRFELGALCRVLDVSRSGYYDWLLRKQQPPSARAAEEAVLLEHIRSFHKESRGTYGSPRVLGDLRASGFHCGKNRLARLMRKHGITARPLKRFVVTTDSKHNLPVAPNHLEQQFGAQKPNTRWSGDITYLWTGEGWLYLAVVLDLCSRRVVGWSMKSTQDRSLVTEALDAALKFRKPAAGLLCHSDRGSQYASGDYQKKLCDAGIVCSMSRKGNCWDNAPVESFFASLKRELVHRTRFSTRQEARAAVFEWIEVWYNRKRRHSSLGYMSPEQFESQQPFTMAA